jgi:hypothetical protein
MKARGSFGRFYLSLGYEMPTEELSHIMRVKDDRSSFLQNFNTSMTDYGDSSQEILIGAAS